MNIKDKEETKTEGDLLKAIFARQTELEEKYQGIEKKNGALVPKIPLDMNTFLGQERARLLIYRITEELYEAGNTMRNKAWKSTNMPIDIDHYLEELADALHFFVQLFLEIGLSAEEVADLYLKKSEVNKFRIRSNY